MDENTDIAKLVAELHELNNQPFMRSYGKKWRMMGLQLLRGIAFGFGSVFGATVMVAVFVYLLGQVDFIQS